MSHHWAAVGVRFLLGCPAQDDQGSLDAPISSLVQAETAVLNDLAQREYEGQGRTNGLGESAA